MNGEGTGAADRGWQEWATSVRIVHHRTSLQMTHGFITSKPADMVFADITEFRLSPAPPFDALPGPNSRD